MGRDTTAEHIGLAEVARSTCKGAVLSAGRDHEHHLEPVSQAPATKIVEGADNHDKDMQRNVFTHSDTLPAPSTLSSKNNLPSSDRFHIMKDLSRSTGADNGSCVESLNHGAPYVSSDTGYSSELNKSANALHSLSAFNGQRGINITQRKIVFDQRSSYNVLTTMGQDYSKTRPDSPLDEPIDYSQLSSRSKERREASTSPNPYVKTETAFAEGQEVFKSKMQIKDDPETYQPRKDTEQRRQYEFILSPKMDRNGNLILGQVSTEYQQADTANSAVTKTQTALVTENYASTMEFPRSSIHRATSPPDSVLNSPTSPQAFPSQSSAVARDSSMNSPESKIGSVKSPGVYHPKLKYLLAASQFAKQKAEEEEAARHGQQTDHFTSSTSTSETSRGETMYAQHDQNRSSPGPQADPSVLKKEPGNPRNYNSSNPLIPPRNDQYAISSNMHQAKMYIMSRETSSISTHSSSRSDAGVTSKGSIFLHPHHQHHHQSSNVFQFKFHPTSAVLSDFQISNLHTGSEQSLLRQFEANVVPTLPSKSPSSSSSSSHHLKQQQFTGVTDFMFSGRKLSTPSSSPSSSPTSSVDASVQSLKSGLDPYECAECGKRYSTSSNLARHRQTHRSVCDKKARKCPHCDKVYVSMPAYSMHVRTHNQGCQCPHCGKKFSRPWLLQGHIRTHTGEKPFACGQCGKSFADKSNLRAHVQTHSTEKPYVCGRCGKAFALKSYLYKHEESSCMRGQRFNRR